MQKTLPVFSNDNVSLACRGIPFRKVHPLLSLRALLFIECNVEICLL